MRGVPCAALAALLLLAGAARAQVPPNESWRTLETPHFRVHFTPAGGLEDLARRAAAEAELAYTALLTGAWTDSSGARPRAPGLHPPRGPIDLVVADNVDFTNGYASTFPSNRIVVYAQPPVSTTSLRAYDDWLRLVVLHELAHVFHLDRTRGWWRGAQRVFGRNPYLFPHAYEPSWLVEGIAVVYESRLTSAGRLNATMHGTIAGAAAEDDAFPGLGDLSAATSRFPGGEGAYAYGSLFLAFLERRYGGGNALPRLIEALSDDVIPFRLNRAARETYGVSFSRAWREWRDSVRASLPPRGRESDQAGGWRVLTPEGRLALHPRWLGDTALVYAASTGKESAGAYRVTLDGRRTRLGRRNGVEPNVPLADSALLFAQLEYVSPYHVRSDLFRSPASGALATRPGDRRLTREARLSLPDARPDGAIVAVQGLPGATRLVRVTADGRLITPLTGGSADEQWTEPRWSPQGNRIAAVRWTRGGFTDVVVLDTTGRTLFTVAGPALTPGGLRVVNSAPSWASYGNGLMFISDRSGSRRPYIVWFDSARGVGSLPVRGSRAIFSVEESPHTIMLAASEYHGDGYHIAVAQRPFAVVAPAADADTTAAALAGERERLTLPPAPRAGGATRRYAPWRSLLPRYWTPVVGGIGGGDGVEIGGETSGYDVVGRHAYSAYAAGNVEHRELDGGVAYRYAGFLRPLLDASLSQQSEGAGAIVNGAAPGTPVVGQLRERTRLVRFGATFVRPGFRTSASASVGGELEWRDFATDPDSLLAKLPPVFAEGVRYRALVASAAWSNAQRPPLSISPEDGIALAVSARERWRVASDVKPWAVVVGSASGYRAMDLGGFAHHVLALRAVGGWTDRDETLEFSAGGVSGAEVEILPGLGIGDQRRNFPVRGFPTGSLRGSRAAGGSLEYRVPLALPSRGAGALPLFVDKLSASAFTDAASMWCGGVAPLSGPEFCPARDPFARWIASAGAELGVTASVLDYDAPLLARIGVAVPVREKERAARATAYLTFGISF